MSPENTIQLTQETSKIVNCPFAEPACRYIIQMHESYLKLILTNGRSLRDTKAMLAVLKHANRFVFICDHAVKCAEELLFERQVKVVTELSLP